MPIRAYIGLAAANPRFIAFGFLLTLCSSFGQTYFIGIFGPSIQAEFDLSHTRWGSVYMIGTLASATLLPWTGKQIDRFDLRAYAAAVCALLAGACAFAAFTPSAVALVVTIFLLRHGGQGLMSHVAITSMGRYFEVNRGRAIGFSTIGYAAGEAVLPFVAVTAIALVGWRWTYAVAAGLLAFAVIPAAMWLLAGHPERHRRYLDGLGSSPNGRAGGARWSWTRRDVLRDPRFYLLQPGLLAPSVALTAMFFHHLSVADAKGWSHEWITGSYVVYAVAAVATSLSSGPIIDRIGAVRLVQFMLWPMVAGLALLGVVDQPLVAWPYLGLIGVTVGIVLTGVAALWAEIYGVEHLGAIRSMAAAFGVFGSALGPVIMGALMDQGVHVNTVSLMFPLYGALGAVLIFVALRGARPSTMSRPRAS